MINKLKKIIKEDNFLSLFGNVSLAFFGSFNLFILARSLSKDSLGEWLLYLLGLTFMEMLRMGIVRTPLIKFLASSDNEKENNQIIASSWITALSVTSLISILIYCGLFSFHEQIEEKGFILFFQIYPILAFSILPFNNALSILQAKRRFDKIVILRLIYRGSFASFLLLNYFFFNLNVQSIVLVHLFITFLVSLITIIKTYSGIHLIFEANKKTILKLFNFGKFSIGTLISSNLLKSSDTFLIGMMLTKAHVAFYSIPLRLIELLEIPVRSFLAVALPKMSKASEKGDKNEVREIFYTYTGVLSILMIPILIVLFLLGKFLIILQGGYEYVGAVTIFYIFLIYGLFLPFDRFIGVTLDSINRPKLNLIKTIIMAISNIIGDFIAIYFFKSLHAVAFVTIINVLIGIIFGIYFLKKELDVSMLKSFVYGLKFLKKSLNKITLTKF